MDKIRLLIAGDDTDFRRGLEAVFKTGSLFEVLGALTIKETIDKSIQSQPDIVLIDIAAEIIPKYKREFGLLKIKCPCSLVIAMVLEEQNSELLQLLEQGIDGLVPRNITRDCLIKTIELVYKSDLFCLPGSMKRMVSLKLEQFYSLAQFKDNLPRGSEFLTRREIEILQMMAKNHSNREIANILFISEPTVKTHVSSILRKLGQRNRFQAVVYSYKNGLVM